MSTESFVPYTYLLYWNDGTKYYGVRYSKKCHPDELLVSYFSSSKYVKEKIKICGLPQAKIHKTFPGDREAAIKYENRVLKILKCADRVDYLNKTYNNAIPSEHNGSSRMKGKTYEEIYGEEKAILLKNMRSKSTRNRKKIKWNIESRSKMSLIRAGSNNTRAKKISLVIDKEKIEFSTIKEAANYLSFKTGFKIAGCMSAIRSKLYGNGTTKQIKFKSLYESFDCSIL